MGSSCEEGQGEEKGQKVIGFRRGFLRRQWSGDHEWRAMSIPSRAFLCMYIFRFLAIDWFLHPLAGSEGSWRWK